MAELTIKCVGTSPLIVHSDRTVNPLDPITKRLKAVTGKRKKTDDDHEEIARIEFEAGLYFDEALGPYIPAQNVERCLRDAATLSRNGKNVVRALIVEDNEIPILYDGPRDIDGLWNAGFYDQRSVKVQQSRTIRTRPMFKDWEIEFQCHLDESIIDLDVFKDIVDKAGTREGLCDGRPRYGRFETTVR